ncbi:MAG: butyrate kinase [Candidatus Cloacimonetes bacterium]|nr:butyrate kinase [Candidatus Cloacimonadota bacterium]
MPDFRILVINPGSTSTKIAVFDNDKEVFKKTLNHKPEELSPFEELIDQFEFRKNIVEEALVENNIHIDSLDAVVGRGGLLRPVPSGIFKINDKMLADLKDPTIWGRVHASNLGAFIAKSIADEFNIPCFIADPVTVDEMEDVARISGVPGIVRQSLFHALNIKSIARKTAKELNKPLTDCNLIGVHMGGGISVAAIKKGKVVDVNNALLGMGPFSTQRAGALPLSGVIDMCFSGEYTKADIENIFTKKSGLMGYLGTDNDIEIEKEVEKGNEKYRQILEVMAYQVSKEIGACATVLKGNVDAIYLTGGLAYDKFLTGWIKERTSFIAQIYIFPGEGEMEALAEAGLRVLAGVEEAQTY